jgi:hypothetical protein
MNAEQSVEEALILLEQMSEDPNEILRVLDDAELYSLMKELSVLAEQAATIESSAELLQLADAILRLVEDRSGLRGLLLSEEIDVNKERSQRTITIDYQQATTELIPICVLRDYSKMGEVGQRTETLRVGFQLVKAITHPINYLIK